MGGGQWQRRVRKKKRAERSGERDGEKDKKTGRREGQGNKRRQMIKRERKRRV